MSERRRYPRTARRLNLVFSANGRTFRGRSVNLSRSGIFIRTNHTFPGGTPVAVRLQLDGNNVSRVSGSVARCNITEADSGDTGIAVHLAEADNAYLDLFHAPTAVSGDSPSSDDAFIINCPQCRVKNRIVASRTSDHPKCGKCGTALIIGASGETPPPNQETPVSPGAAETSPHHTPHTTGRTYAVGNIISDRYQVQEVFGGEGKSSMGVVYMCYDIENDRILALKTLQKRYLESEKIVDSFKKEALAWICLDKHPHIVRAFWVRELEGSMFIACEFILPDEGGRNALTAHLDSPIPLDRGLRWAIQFCHGMEYAFSKGVTPHRDIKPDNIMITMDGDLKITDFGLVGLRDTAGGDGGIGTLIEKNQKDLSFIPAPNQRIVAGSPPWMAPEQFYGVAEVRSDIYSFGIVLYQLLNNGRHPLTLKPGDTWRKAHKEYPLPPLPRETSAIAPIVERCLEKRRDKRYRDFSALRVELEQVFRSQITRRTGENPPEAPAVEGMKESDLVNKGMSLANLGLLDEGIRNYREGLKKNPLNAVAHYNLGNALAQKGTLNEAIRSYREAVRLDPELAAAHFNLGIALAKKGETDEAIFSYREALRCNPALREASLNLGAVLQKQGRNNDAIPVYREAVRIRPDAADVHLRLGLALATASRFDDAIDVFRAALRCNPSYAEAYNNLGTALMRKERTDEAISMYGRAVSINPQYAEAYFNMGLAFIKQGMHREALGAIEEFMKRCRPDDSRTSRARELIAKLKRSR